MRCLDNASCSFSCSGGFCDYDCDTSSGLCSTTCSGLGCTGG
jgi:hypothetical protein